ncbi:MAG: choice-of-anchor B family protein [Rhodothermaceae bacterium]|nr:choice-of-anchor B family protein [Rhodothermaceae bacterium]
MPLLLLAGLVALGSAADAQECEGGGDVVADPVDGTLYPCENITLLGRLPLADMGVPTNPSTNLPYRGNDIWGWTDPQDGREYALVGNKSGVYFVEVSETDGLRPLGALPTETVATTWRDIKVYQNHAFAVADGAGEHGMQVFDLTRLRGLEADPTRVYSADAVYRGTVSEPVASAHNVAINEDTGFAYIVGAGSCAGGFHMVDLQNPLAPTFVGCFAADGYTHDVHCVTYAGPDADYSGHEICVGSNDDVTVIVDVTDKANPLLISRVFYPNTGYAHQGWFGPRHRYFYADDESDELQGLVANTRTLQFDFADLDAPFLASEFFHETEATDHNLYVDGDFIYLANNASGLRIIQILGMGPTDALAATAYLDTYPEGDAAGFEGAWSSYPFFGEDKVVVSDRTRGLFVVQGPNGTLTANEPTGPVGAFVLDVPAPNPFRSQTRLTLTAEATQYVRVVLYDALGRQLGVLHEGAVSAQDRLILDVDGRALAPGVYLVRVEGEQRVASQRLVRVR